MDYSSCTTIFWCSDAKGRSDLQTGGLLHTISYCTCWTISRTGLYRAKGQNRPFLVLEPYTPRTRYLPRNSKYRGDSAVANGVLVRLICDGLAWVLDRPILDCV